VPKQNRGVRIIIITAFLQSTIISAFFTLGSPLVSAQLQPADSQTSFQSTSSLYSNNEGRLQRTDNSFLQPQSSSPLFLEAPHDNVSLNVHSSSPAFTLEVVKKPATIPKSSPAKVRTVSLKTIILRGFLIGGLLFLAAKLWNRFSASKKSKIQTPPPVEAITATTIKPTSKKKKGSNGRRKKNVARKK